MSEAYLWAVASSSYEAPSSPWTIEWRDVSVSDAFYKLCSEACVFQRILPAALADDHRHPNTVEKCSSGRLTVRWNTKTNADFLLDALESNEEYYDLAALWKAVCDALKVVRSLGEDDDSLSELRTRLERVRVPWKVRLQILAPPVRSKLSTTRS